MEREKEDAEKDADAKRVKPGIFPTLAELHRFMSYMIVLLSIIYGFLVLLAGLLL